MDPTEVTLMAVIFGGIVLFFIMRAFWLWYFGINEILEELRATNYALAHMPGAIAAAVRGEGQTISMRRAS